MPRRDGPPGGGGDNFHEALAQWRLGLRTEVKKTSSLPSAMFDACDPMLEARLAETARAMLARLHGAAPVVEGSEQVVVQKRLERVTPDDLKQLPAQFAAIADAPVDLESGLVTEYLAVLADTCCHATGLVQQGAAHLLQRDFGLSPTNDADALLELLGKQVREDPRAVAGGTACTDERLLSACHRVAAALALLEVPDLSPDAITGGDP